MSALFLDTSYVVALVGQDEQHHPTVQQHWMELASSLPPLVTTSFVVDEIATLLNARGQHALAVDTCERLLHSSSVELVHVDAPLFSESWQFFKRHCDKSYSLTDCVSFVVMQARGMNAALSLDRHFQQARFGALP